MRNTGRTAIQNRTIASVLAATALYACTITNSDGVDGGPSADASAPPVDAGRDDARADAATSDASSDDASSGVDAGSTDGGARVDCTLPPAAGPAGAVVATATGGLWNDKATWVGGKVPGAADHVVIHGEVQVDLGPGDTTVSCASVTIASDGVLRAAAYAARKLAVRGDIANFGAVRNGPNYASYDTATLEVQVGGRFFQQGDYGVLATHFTGTSDQGLAVREGKSLSGRFVDDDPSSALRACAPLSVASLQLEMGTGSARGTLDMGEHALTLSQGEIAITNGVLRAGKIVGVAGATLNSDKITAIGTLSLDGDVRTAATTIDGSVKVLSTGVVYNIANATPTVAIRGNLENNGTVRRGPGYAAYGEGDLTIDVTGDIVQNGPYTPTKTNLTGSAKQTITLGAGQVLRGTFTDTTPASPIAAGSDLTIDAAVFEVGTLDMGSHALTHPTGDLKLATGTLLASSITGGPDGNSTFNVATIRPPSGTLTIDGNFRTDASTIDGAVKVLATGVVYNIAYATPTLTVRGNLENNGIVRRGPGYAAYGEGDLTIDITGDIVQKGPYTPTKTNLTGPARQAISLGSGQVLVGTFTDTTPTSAIAAGSDLKIDAATFELGPVGGPEGTLDMGSHGITHTTGDLKIVRGQLLADSITGGDNNSGSFTIPKIVPPSGTLTVNKHYPTSTTIIDGKLVVETGAHVYNEYNVEAHVTVTGTITQKGSIGSGQGYASYDSGSLYLNGLKLSGW